MSFKDILGHDKEIAALKKAILNSRVAHSFIFSGPDGIGKRLTALEFARALNCGGFNGDSCGVCPSCKMMDAGTHPNLLQVWPTVKGKEPERYRCLLRPTSSSPARLGKNSEWF